MLEPSLAPADDTSFARSSDPCRSIATSLLGGATHFGGGALESVSRSGKLGESQEEPAPGSLIADLARLAASHRSRKGGCVRRQKRKGVTALVPARIARARGFCPHVVLQLQKSAGDAWSRRSSSHALQKERQGRVNGDLGHRGPRRSNVGGARMVETANRHPGSLR